MEKKLKQSTQKSPEKSKRLPFEVKLGFLFVFVCVSIYLTIYTIQIQFDSTPFQNQIYVALKKLDTQGWVFQSLEQAYPNSDYPIEVVHVAKDFANFKQHHEPQTFLRTPVGVLSRLKYKDRRPTYLNKYKSYKGLLHAHTAISDGISTPEESLDLAKNIAKLDFFALTDHSEFFYFRFAQPYQHLKELSKQWSDSTFLAIPGFEYSHHLEGHLVILGADQWTSSLSHRTIYELYNWLTTQPDALAIFAHPGLHPIRRYSDFREFLFDPKLKQQVIGLEAIHWGHWLVYSKGFSRKIPYIDEAILKGWWLAPIASQDAHDGSSGLIDESRTGVLASELTHDAILEAIKGRRTFATQVESMDAVLTVLNPKDGSLVPMGSGISLTQEELIKPISGVLQFVLLEAHRFPIKRVEFVSNGEVFWAQDMTGSNAVGSLNFTFPELKLTPGQKSYFYARFFHVSSRESVTQTSPIYIECK